MKAEIILTLMIFIFTGISGNAQVKNIDLKKLSINERNDYLIKIGKELTLTFGPDYYQLIKGTPKISEPKVSETEKDDKAEISKNAGREYLEVTFPYDTTKIKLDWNHASLVRFWVDTGEPMSIFFGNGMGFDFSIIDLNTQKKAKRIIPLQKAESSWSEINVTPTKEEIEKYKESMKQKENKGSIPITV